VTIVRQHHPLCGQQFEVLQGGNRKITIRLKDGTSMRIPRLWTDADGDPPPNDCRTEMRFTVDSLRRLLDLVEAFSRR
jgi:hypothetical protein